MACEPEIAVGDSKYGTVANMVGLEQGGIRAYIPIPDLKRNSKFYTIDKFPYDPDFDSYTCPRGHKLPLWSRAKPKRFLSTELTSLSVMFALSNPNAPKVKVDVISSVRFSEVH